MLHRRSIHFLGWRPDKPDHRDRRRAAGDSSILAGLPPAATLPGAEQFLPPIRDQGEQGSCVGHAIAQAIQYKRSAMGQEPLVMSPRFAYYNARLIEGNTGTDAGAEIRDGIKAVHKVGLCDEGSCPYDDTVVSQRPSPLAYRRAQRDILRGYQRLNSADIAEIKSSIVNGDPVVFGFSTFENLDGEEVANTGLLTMPEGEMTGGHAVWAVGFDDAWDTGESDPGALWIANSWGNQWGAAGPNGERGYLWMPYQYATNLDLADDFWHVDMVT